MGKILLTLLFIIFLSGCSGNDSSYKNNSNIANNTASYATSPSDIREARVGKLLGNDVVLWNSNGDKSIFGKQKIDGANISVNPYVWHAALHKVSFMPIAVANPSAGIITTEWYQINPKSYEKYKINVIISGNQINPNAVKVRVFKEIKNQADGKWHATGVSSILADKIAEQIIDNARKLRSLQEFDQG